MTKHVVVLGAGFGGLELATSLSESLGDDVHVTLIDQSDSFLFGFEKLDVLLGRRAPDDIRLYYRDIASDRVEFRQERVTSIDPSARTVVTDGNTYESDFLVVALGADYVPEATPGFVEDGHEFYSVEGAARLSEALRSVEKGRILISVLGLPFKCPPAPFEGTVLIHDYLAERGVRDACEITMMTPLELPIPVSPDTSKALLGALDQRGITFMPKTRATAIDPATNEAKLESGETLSYDLFIGIPIHKVTDVVKASGLTEGGTDGWIKVDPTNLRTPYDNVYAIGDNADAPIPRAGVFAEAEARVVAKDITARLRDATPPEPFDGAGICYIEFGNGLVGRVNVNFLGGPKPTAPFTPPSLEGAHEKADFASSRRARWFGV